MLDTQPPNDPLRTEIESRIITTATTIRRESVQDCYNGATLEFFLIAWRNLDNYYEAHVDFMINIEVVRDFIDCQRLLTLNWQDETKPETCLDEAYEALDELNAHMDNIIVTVQRRKYPDGW